MGLAILNRGMIVVGTMAVLTAYSCKHQTQESAAKSDVAIQADTFNDGVAHPQIIYRNTYRDSNGNSKEALCWKICKSPDTNIESTSLMSCDGWLRGRFIADLKSTEDTKKQEAMKPLLDQLAADGNLSRISMPETTDAMRLAVWTVWGETVPETPQNAFVTDACRLNAPSNNVSSVVLASSAPAEAKVVCMPCGYNTLGSVNPQYLCMIKNGVVSQLEEGPWNAGWRKKAQADKCREHQLRNECTCVLDAVYNETTKMKEPSRVFEGK